VVGCLGGTFLAQPLIIITSKASIPTIPTIKM
jgi:hypothetical protein